MFITQEILGVIVLKFVKDFLVRPRKSMYAEHIGHRYIFYHNNVIKLILQTTIKSITIKIYLNLNLVKQLHLQKKGF